VAEILGGLGTRLSMAVLTPLLSDPVEDVRVQASLALARANPVEALRKMAGPMAAPVLETGPDARLEDVRRLRDFIADRFGLWYDDDRLNVLQHRMAPLSIAEGFPALGDYLRHLEEDPLDLRMTNALVSQLTNNETYFFREIDPVTALARHLVTSEHPDTAAFRERSLRVLSAGCATGEEPFSIAMVFDDEGVNACFPAVEILGLDIDAAAIETAVRGRYTAHSFRGRTSRVIDRYFRPVGTGYEIVPRLRAMVRFQQGNILTIGEIGRFDYIFCRNALIYFSDTTLERAARNLHGLLAPGGCLFLGHSESFCRINTDFLPFALGGHVVYRKDVETSGR
jgi:chemotaxis protein methyltransferase CheR